MSTPGSDVPLWVNSSSLRKSLGVDDSVVEDVRAVGAVVGDRVPELIEDFYEWLAPLPEFEHFFSDRTLLARVKEHQRRYWREFLRAELDDEYVERRQRVGYTHARIELGLLIYLRAMEFVSSWFIRHVAAHDGLCRERPSAMFSIRKLIQFDSAIVVNTYATRTAQLIEEQRERLQRVAQVMQAVTEGDLEHQLAVSGAEDLLGSSVNDMVQSLRSIAREMGAIARGDYSADSAPRSQKDELGISLQAMTRALRGAAAENERHMWVARSQSQLGQAMSGNPTVKELSDAVVAYLVKGPLRDGTRRLRSVHGRAGPRRRDPPA